MSDPMQVREELAAVIARVTNLWDEPLDEVHDIAPLADAIIAAGWAPTPPVDMVPAAPASGGDATDCDDGQYGGTDDFPAFLTRQEAANQLRCTLMTIDRRIKNGSLKHYKLGRKVLIDPADLRRLLISRGKDS